MNEINCALTEARALEYLNAALPLADRITLGEEAVARVARHALALRQETPWGPSIPEDVFLAYVLFPRVNNENPAFYHAAVWDELRPRLSGLDMEGAVREVNRWCFEKATYQATDARTANALTVIRRGFGRCGEESVLLVSALRACGIPARQIYVPLWSHCDDNHAWVEAWIDGKWRYMGACEPELSLDSGWFTAAASKAMLVHTRAWGVLPEGERAEARAAEAWIVNRTAAYAGTALLRVQVIEGGVPKAGLRVDFEVANMAAYRPISKKHTDAQGRAELLCGLGTLHLWMTDGARYLERTVDVAAQSAYTFDFAEARPFGPGEGEFEQRPPRESRIQPTDFPPEAVEAHEGWLARAERARQERFAVPEGVDPLVRDARGNAAVVEAFLRDERYEPEDARALLESLSYKDLSDVTADVLTDALEGALPWKARYPRDVWAEAVLCPRVKNEMLYPARKWMRERLPAFEDPQAVWAHLLARARLCDMEPESLMPDPRAALGAGVCSPALRDVLFVGLCRANGIAARLDPVTGEKQLWQSGGYHPLLAEREPTARLVLENRAGRALTAGIHFSVSALRDGAFVPLEMYGDALEDELSLSVPAGLCRVMTASRQIDGSLQGRIWLAELAGGETRRIGLTLPEDRTADKLLRAPLAPLRAKRATGEAAELPAALNGRPAIVACIAPGQEPTEHFLNELLEAREALGQRGIAVRLLVSDWKRARNDKLAKVLEELPDTECLAEPDAGALIAWRRALNAGELRLPLAVAVGTKGEGLFAFVNYNVGSVVTLIKIIDAR